jgi:GntR family transcriptional regulator
MARKTDGRPRHQQIAAALRALIMSGDLAAGTQLPTTQQLMLQYAVTGQTVQRALAVLKDEGFVVGRAGVGVYVREMSPLAIEPAAYIPPSEQGEPSLWATQAKRRAQRGRVQLLDVRRVSPPAAVATALGLHEGAQSLLRQQLLLLDDEPVEVAWLYFPLEIAQGTPLTERKLIRSGTTRLLADLGYPPVEWVDQLSVRLATTEELELLELPDDVPVLRTLRTVSTSDGSPIEVSVLVKGGHRYELSYRQQVRSGKDR